MIIYILPWNGRLVKIPIELNMTYYLCTAMQNSKKISLYVLILHSTVKYYLLMGEQITPIIPRIFSRPIKYKCAISLMGKRARLLSNSI